MEKKSKYPTCDIKGYGTLSDEKKGGKGDFRIIEISAAEISMSTDYPLEKDSLCSLDIKLDGILFVINIKTKGSVSELLKNGYKLKFIGLTDADREEIDEIVKSSCSLI